MATPNINKILLADNRSSSRGAPMGDSSVLDAPEEPLYVQKVRMVDGAYGPDGTYWGIGTPLWCGFSVTGGNRVYVRADNRGEAIRLIHRDFPDALIHGPFGRVGKQTEPASKP